MRPRRRDGAGTRRGRRTRRARAHFRRLDYPRAASTTALPARSHRALALMLGWPRVRVTLIISVALGLLLGIHWESGPPAGIACAVIVGLFAMLVFGVFEQWPKRLPRFLERWVLQVLGVAFAVPWATLVIYIVTTAPGGEALHQDKARNQGFGALIGIGLLIAPGRRWRRWCARRRRWRDTRRWRSSLERSEHERQALDARLRSAAGAGRSALPVQHAGQRAGAGRRGIAAGVGRCCAA